MSYPSKIGHETVALVRRLASRRNGITVPELRDYLNGMIRTLPGGVELRHLTVWRFVRRLERQGIVRREGFRRRKELFPRARGPGAPVYRARPDFEVPVRAATWKRRSLAG